MSRFKLLVFVIFLTNVCWNNAQISDKRLCVDKECTVPVSQAKTLLRYSSPDTRILSFGPNVDITIYSKAAGSREDLWGAEIKGKRGYVPKHLVRETKVLQKPTILVDTEPDLAEKVPSSQPETNKNENQVLPDTVQEPYEVIDGTTIHLSPQDIAPSSTESPPVQPTALPENPASQPETASEESVLSKLTEWMDDDGEDDEDDEEFDDTEEDEEEEPETLKEEPEVAQDVPLPEIPPIQEVTQENPPSQIVQTPEVSNQTENIENAPETEESVKKVELQESAEVSGTEEAVNESESVPSPVASEEPPPQPTEETQKPEIKEIPQVNISQEIDADNRTLLEPQETVEEAEELEETPKPEDNSVEFNNTEEFEDISNETSQEIDQSSETTTLTTEYDIADPLEGISLDVTPNPVAVEALAYTSTEEVETTTVQIPVIVETEKIEVTNEDLDSHEEAEEEEDPEVIDTSEESPGFISGLFSMVSGVLKKDTAEQEPVKTPEENRVPVQEEEIVKQKSYLTGEKSENFVEYSKIENIPEEFCSSESCPGGKPQEATSEPSETGFFSMDLNLNTDLILFLVTTAVSVIIFLFGYILFDKSKREGPLVAKINKLEKDLLVCVKENQILQEQGDPGATGSHNNSELIQDLNQQIQELLTDKQGLEEQVQSLEKELEDSTEVGMELNRIMSEMLNSQNGSDSIKTNIEHLQRQLVEQQGIINSISETLAATNSENRELKVELENSNKKVLDLQAEVDKMFANILKIEEEKEGQQGALEAEISSYKQKYQELETKFKIQDNKLNSELTELKSKLTKTERNLDVKSNEYAQISVTLKSLKSVKNSEETVKSLLDVAHIKAELQVMQEENKKYVVQLAQEQESRGNYEKQAETAAEEAAKLKRLYEEADKLKVESQTKLEVLQNYFKEREAQLQRELSKHEALWVERQGEATSTSERNKFIQEQLQNYKSQNESLKQEIINQEVELKSQISVLEKKVHENWVSARQAERKLEDAKQESAQLRHRLTLRERALVDDHKGLHRLQSPVELNGESPIESPASPPLLYGGRDHMTKSPPLPGLPPFLPPPPGVPFMPPPHFIPPPPSMFPEDHRPPPLGRMSSPPINSRYSPSSRGGFSPYDSSPSEEDWESSPPQRPNFGGVRGKPGWNGRNKRL